MAGAYEYGRRPKLHRIMCSCCYASVSVPISRKFLCDSCFHGEGNYAQDFPTAKEVRQVTEAINKLCGKARRFTDGAYTGKETA